MTRQGAENQATNVLEQKGDRSHSTRLNDTADRFTRDGCGSHGIRGDSWCTAGGEGTYAEADMSSSDVRPGWLPV